MQRSDVTVAIGAPAERRDTLIKAAIRTDLWARAATRPRRRAA